jgi:hypothetical protein
MVSACVGAAHQSPQEDPTTSSMGWRWTSSICSPAFSLPAHTLQHSWPSQAIACVLRHCLQTAQISRASHTKIRGALPNSFICNTGSTSPAPQPEVLKALLELLAGWHNQMPRNYMS